MLNNELSEARKEFVQKDSIFQNKICGLNLKTNTLGERNDGLEIKLQELSEELETNQISLDYYQNNLIPDLNAKVETM